MSNLPQVSIAFSNGNLLSQTAVIDGNAAFIGNAHTVGNKGIVFTINSLADAETQGITAIAEPEAHRQLSEFYNELGGTQQVYLLLLDTETTMAQMLDSTSAIAANKLINAGAGTIAYLGVFKTPAGDYAGAGADYMDADVAASVIASKTFLQAWNTKGFYFRVLIAGCVNTETSNTIYAPNTAANGFAGVVLLSTANDKLASIGLVLGRKVKYACNIKIGKVANGPLSVPQLYIGTKKVEDVTNLDALAGAGYIVPVTYPNKAGYYFGVDNMASNDDYHLLAYGAVIDAAARVANAYYVEQLESEINVDASGKLLDEDAKHLEDNITSQELSNLGDRISNVLVIVDRNQIIVPGNTLNVRLRIIPKGYFTWIDVDLGLTT